MSEVRSMPCSSCPYRRDVPSGVWAAHEYEKLVDYDRTTGEQPIGVFACHATPEATCHGWAVVHSNRGHEYDLLALRLWPTGDIPEAGVPLFDSGTEAAAHGLAAITDPDPEAVEVIERLMRKYPRLRSTDDEQRDGLCPFCGTVIDGPGVCPECYEAKELA